MTKHEYYYWCSHSKVIKPRHIRALLKAGVEIDELYNLNPTLLQALELWKPKELSLLNEEKSQLDIRRGELERLEKRGIHFLINEDKEYPERLKQLYDYPIWLFVKGRVPADCRPTAAVIGARDCTHYGSEMALWFAKGLAEAGVQIIGGMALGIDTKGHEGALKAGGETYAVLGSGVDVCYPRRNDRLYLSIQKAGGIVSEYLPGTQPLPSNFPVRNRIISGLSDIVLVLEARSRSGSLITADSALEQGKDVMALPGRVGDALSEGCNWLIANGAKVLRTPQDALEELGITGANICKFTEKEKLGLDKHKKLVYSCMDLTPKYLEDIINETQLDQIAVIHNLLELELQDLIIQTSKNYYAIKIK